MSTPKKTKFGAIMDLESAVGTMLWIGFSYRETKDIFRDMIRRMEKSDINKLKLKDT